MVTSEQRIKRSSGSTITTPIAASSSPAEAVLVGASRVAAGIADPGETRSRDEWLAVAGDCQSLINTLTAVQDTAIAEAARRESVWCEDGTLGETAHSHGRVTLDAADVVAPVIGATHPQAQRRVEQAVRLAARRVPVPADGRDLPEASGLGGLHEAMASGHLDGYRAGVVAFELEVAPADVADAIVTALSGHFGDDASSLRRRTRVLLSRISPDLVRERAQRARAKTGLRRWVAEPGVDEWHGTFPSEDAASAWAAIDRLAHDLVAAGTCTNIEQARGKALTDLVTGNATIDVQIVLTVPADIQTASESPEVTEAAPDQCASAPVGLVSRAGVLNHTARGAWSTLGDHDTVQRADAGLDGLPAPALASAETAVMVTVHTGQQATPAPFDDHTADMVTGPVVTSAPSDGPAEVRDARSSTHTAIEAEPKADPVHPPVTAAGSYDDAGDGHNTPRPTHTGPHAGPEAVQRAHPVTEARSDDDLIEVQGSRPSEPLLVRRAWLRDHLQEQPPQHRRRVRQAPSPFVPCDPLTGARLDPGDDLATDAYRPGTQLAALVRARDGRCRFPGCCVSARFCDLDHVRPWPLGRTVARNLLTLCRRHHRIKQRAGWRVRLAPDGTAAWTDPTGRVRTTAPLDALKALVLTADAVPDRPATPPTPEVAGVTGACAAWSALETHLEFTAEHHPHAHRERQAWLPPTHRRCTSAADLRVGLARRGAKATAFLDVPPF